MTSPSCKVGQILNWYISANIWTIDEKLKISEMLTAIFLVYTTSGIASTEIIFRKLKMAAILNFFIYWTQLQFDLRYEKIVPNYVIKSIVHENDVTGWP